MALFGNPNFTGSPSGGSQPVYTDQDLYRQAEERYRSRVAQANAYNQRMQANQLAEQNAMAQQLVDYFTANPAYSRAANYAYGQAFDPDGVAGPNAGPAGFFAIPENLGIAGGTQYGTIDAVSGMIPTLDEARAILNSLSNANNGPAEVAGFTNSLTDNLTAQLDPNVPSWFRDWMASGMLNNAMPINPGDVPTAIPRSENTNRMNFLDPEQSNRDLNFLPLLNPLDVPYAGMGAPLGGNNDFLNNLMVDAGLLAQNGTGGQWSTRDVNNLFGTSAAQMPMPNPNWAAPVDRRIAQRNDAAATAANAFTQGILGGNYAGGVIDERYSQPFGAYGGIQTPPGGLRDGLGMPEQEDAPWDGAWSGFGGGGLAGMMGGFDPSNLTGNMGWGNMGWGQAGYGGPGSGNQSISAYQPSRLGGFGGGGREQQNPWGGAWGASNGWTF